MERGGTLAWSSDCNSLLGGAEERLRQRIRESAVPWARTLEPEVTDDQKLLEIVKMICRPHGVAGELPAG